MQTTLTGEFVVASGGTAAWRIANRLAPGEFVILRGAPAALRLLPRAATRLVIDWAPGGSARVTLWAGAETLSFEAANALLETIKVQSVTLDDFTAQQGITRIDLLKMDIEGAEIRALEGARGLIQRCAIGCLYLELTFSRSSAEAPLAAEVISYLDARGYRLSCLYNLQHSKNSPALAYCDGLFVPGRAKSAI